MTLRVLHCIYDDPGNPWVAGGGAVRVGEIYRRLAGAVDVTVATGNFPGARDEVIAGVRYRRVGARRPYAWSRLSYAAGASRLLADGDYDVAVFDFSGYTPLILPRGRPVGVTVHHLTGPTARDRWGRPLGAALAAWERATLGRARWFTATSLVTFRELRGLVPKDAVIELVGAGVPDELFTLERREEEYLLYFGRLDWYQKGLDTLLDAMAILAGRHAGLELRLAGRGKDADRVRAAVRGLGIDANVRMLGPVDEEARRALFRGAIVAVMPSRFEGFGLVAAEAMAAGIPLVAAAAGALPEVVAPPEGGVLVPPEDPSSLADAVTSLLMDPSRRQVLSRTARRSAERFRWDRVASEHLAFLQRIANDS